ncbi:MAG TPA: hypothetical protein VK483_13680 [Chitinophagaceae bacterium]|nr:hypothetical protein [Chitinophagaceae bacterium]
MIEIELNLVQAVAAMQLLAAIMMRPQFCITFLFVFGLVSCGQKSNSTDKTKSKMKLTFEVIPEDFEKNLYYVEWNDTLGQSDGYQGDKLIKRPKEVWCIITNDSKDTLGYYRGLSTAETFAGFQSKDTIVTLNFMIGLNFFTDKFESGQNEDDYEKAARDYSKDNKLPIVFEPIQINLKTDLRKKYDMELKEK